MTDKEMDIEIEEARGNTIAIAKFFPKNTVIKEMVTHLKAGYESLEFVFGPYDSWDNDSLLEMAIRFFLIGSGVLDPDD